MQLGANLPGALSNEEERCVLNDEYRGVLQSGEKAHEYVIGHAELPCELPLGGLSR